MSAVLLASAVTLVVVMLVTWSASLAVHDAGIVDIVWGLAFVAVAVMAGVIVGGGSGDRRLLLTVLVTVWGVRLAGYLAWRNLGRAEDYRYRAMRKKHGHRFGLVSLVRVFGPQGVLAWIVSLPVQLAATAERPPGLGPLAVVGVVLWAIGFCFESVGDLQLAGFKDDPANEGRVMDRGLWRYTRHPNYFGDFCVWWGIFLVAAETGPGRWGVIGPIVMSVLLLKVSGVAMLERTIAHRRPGYADYVHRTSAFFPRPPR